VIDMSLALTAQVAVSAGSLTSVVLAGRRTAAGAPRFPYAPWVLLIAAHGLFLGYALVSGQPGFLLLNVGMVAAGALNFRAARRAAKRGQSRPSTPEPVPAVPSAATGGTPAERE
jgi:hypothetical protein